MLRPPFALALVAGLAPAQMTTVIPFTFAGQEASTSTNIPFGRSGPVRLQQIYPASRIAGAPMSIVEIAPRGDGLIASPAKSGVSVQIAISSSPGPVYQPSPVFASNRGTDHRIVFNTRLVSLPALAIGTYPPSPSFAPFALDAPFAYVPSNGNLLIEYEIAAQPAGDYRLDTASLNPASRFFIGQPCGGVQNARGGVAMDASSVLEFTLSGAAAGFDTAIHILGALPRIVPLPWSNGCFLYETTELATIVPVAGGVGALRYPLQLEHSGLTVYGQYLLMDPVAFRLGATESIAVLIGGYEPQSRVYDTTSLANTSGTVQPGVGIVTRIKY